MNNLISYINNEIKPLKHTDTIADAQDLFTDFPYTHFPVTEEGVYVGCVSKESIEFLKSDMLVNENRFHFERFFVRSSVIWLDVLEIFAKNETNLIPVLDEKNNYLGYYELEDIIRFFHETPFLKEEGGIIVVEKESDQFTMSQITQIVESNNAKILGLFISKIAGNKIEITIKISQSGLNDIIQTFRRYEYEIISEHQEDSYLNSLKERSDYLDKYLNI
ncbi:CBS domain-containing protein [Flavobacterium cucumis]|uniref:CBS domain-containing protein n=1 Tax=Flavobacterium cucumis TaxID=416016 RepID=A0A1M7ZTW8_9FLAO|nr:CBS domain-containing protein [Flavobacterium cucumis]SHO72057.1 CBS domain-containing protein [Flavobacterium cucumis]